MSDTAIGARGNSRPDHTHNLPEKAPHRPTRAVSRQQSFTSDKLTGRHWFTSAQVADLIHRAFNSGFVHGVGEGAAHEAHRQSELMLDALAAALIVPPFSEAELRREGYRQTARREADTAAAYPWRTDHPGGPVATW
jgi:hypothetical protein